MKVGDWEWLDWSNIPGLLDWVAFVLGGLGIGFTLLQLLRSRNSLQAAERALADARLRLTTNQLAVLLPRISEIERSLETALQRNSARAAEEALHRFGLLAAESAELLKAAHQYDGLAQEVNAAAKIVSDARSEMFPINPTMRSARVAAGEAPAIIARLAQKFSAAAVSIRNDLGSAR